MSYLCTQQGRTLSSVIHLGNRECALEVDAPLVGPLIGPIGGPTGAHRLHQQDDDEQDE